MSYYVENVVPTADGLSLENDMYYARSSITEPPADGDDNIRYLEGNVGNVRIQSGCTAYLEGGATAGNIVIDRGGVMIVPSNYGYNEPLVKGTITIAGQLDANEDKISGKYKFKVIWDISAGVISKKPMILNMENVASMNFNINVSSRQKAGKYVLATGLVDLPSNFSFGIGTGKKFNHSISIRNTYSSNGLKYKLTLTKATLYLTVSGRPDVAPDAPTVSANITARTNKNVTLTAKFGSGSAKKQYSLNKKTWNTYKSGVKMTKNGTVYFRSLSSTGKVSKIVSYKVANIDKTPPKTPKALADITAKTVGGTVTVTASFSSDSVTKQYSTDGKTWQDYEGGIEFTVNGAIWFRGIDSVGNVSKAAKYSVTNIVTPMALATQVSGKVGYSGILTAELRPLLESPGLYKLTADFGSLNGALTVKTGKTTVASATIRKGKLTFKVGSTDLLLDSAKSYTIAITNSDKGKSKTDFTCTLAEQTLFEHPDRSTADDKWSAAPVLMAEEAINGGWVGFSDAIDYREFTGVAETGGLYKFDLTGATNKVKLTVYEVQTTKVKGKTTTSLNALKSVTATASASTGNLALSGSKRYIVAVAAVDAAKGKNSEYDLTTTKSGVFTGTGNNSIAKATKLAAEDELNGMLSKVSGGDTVDFYDLASVKGQSLNLTMDSGALKVTFCDKNGKAIKVASVTMADTVTVKKNISSLTLASGTATGSIAFMASASNLRYLKIEAPSGGVNAYRLAVQAVV